MANIFQKIGSAFGQYGMNDKMAADDFVNLPKDQKRAMQIQGLQKFADAMGLVAAQQSGDPRRIQLAQQTLLQKAEERQAKLQEQEINKAIDAANLPESQKQLLKQLDPKTQASILFREPEPEPGKQAIIDSILRKKLSGEKLTKQENLLYQDLVLRPTYQERLIDPRYRTQGFSGPSQSSSSVIPTITTEEQFNNLPSGSQFYFEGKLQTKE
jgi:hypothetical protein